MFPFFVRKASVCSGKHEPDPTPNSKTPGILSMSVGPDGKVQVRRCLHTSGKDNIGFTQGHVLQAHTMLSLFRIGRKCVNRTDAFGP